jgi:hypothetical protein
MTAVPVRRRYRLEVGDLSSTPVRLIRAPQLSMLSWLMDFAAGRPLPGGRGAALDRVLSAQGRRVLPALGMPGLDRLPGCLSAIGDGTASSVAEHAEFLADADGAILTEEVCRLWGERPPDPWRTVLDRPRAWLRAAAQAFLDAWIVGEVHYRAADLLARREEARVGSAAITGNLGLLLDGLDPRLHVCEGFLVFDADCEQTIRLGDRQVALVPMLVPARRMIVDFESLDCAYVAYALPGANPGLAPRSPESAAADRLTALLGPVRATILRALDRPLPMRVLARTVHCSPSTLTYHCDQLAAAGLLLREPQGRSMLVCASERAQGLIDLLT